MERLTSLFLSVTFCTSIYLLPNRQIIVHWNPDAQNATFFHQSAYLHATYYYIQIQIYRPFLTKKSALSFPALAVCTNAARLCADMLEVTATRGVRITTPNLIVEPILS